MAYQITPLRTQNYGDEIVANTDKMYKNVTTKFRWGGLDTPEGRAGKTYLDETVRRMVNTTRTMMITLANSLVDEATAAQEAKKDGKATIYGENVDKFFADRVAKAEKVLALMHDKMSEKACAYSFNNRMQMGRVYESLYQLTNKEAYRKSAIALVEGDLMQFSQYDVFAQRLSEKYPMLSTCNIDNYLAHSYLPQLLMIYEQINKAGYPAMLKKLAAKGVDTRAVQASIQMMLQQQSQPQQHQEDKLR